MRLKNGRFWDMPENKALPSSAGTTLCIKTRLKINVSLLAFAHEF